MKIIALCGLKGVGKDRIAETLCQIYQTKYKYPAKKTEINEQFKELIMKAFNLDTLSDYRGLASGYIKLPNNKVLAGKDLVKNVGNIFREINPQFVINTLDVEIENIKYHHPELYKNGLLIITDLKFIEEVKWCKTRHIPLIKIERQAGVFEDPGIPLIDNFLCDYRIDNNTEESEVEKQAEDLLDNVVKF